MVSIVWDQRTFPIYFELLAKLGSSNINEHKEEIDGIFIYAHFFQGNQA